MNQQKPPKRRLKILSVNHIDDSFDDDNLPEALDIIVRGMESLLKECDIGLHPSTKNTDLSQIIIPSIVVDSQMAQRIINRIKKNQSLPDAVILQYQQRLELCRDKAREITTSENLGRSTK